MDEITRTPFGTLLMEGTMVRDASWVTTSCVLTDRRQIRLGNDISAKRLCVIVKEAGCLRGYSMKFSHARERADG